MDDVQFRSLMNQLNLVEGALIQLRLDSLKRQISEASSDRNRVELLTREFISLKDVMNGRS